LFAPALLGLCLALSAIAPTAPELALLPIEGPSPAAVERAVAGSLGDARLRFWPGAQVRRRLLEAGIAATDPALVAKTAVLLRVSMVLRARRSGVEIAITLYAASGEVLARLRYPGRRDLSILRSTLARRLAEALDRGRRVSRAPPLPARPRPKPTASAAPAPTPVPADDFGVAPPPPEAEKPLPADTSADEPPWPVVVDLELGGGSLGHWLNYKDDLFNSLPDYTLIAGPLVAGGLAFYPGGLATRGFLADIGVIGEFYQTAGLTSSFENESFPTQDDRWTAGLRVRIPIGSSELGVSGRYGQQDFKLGVIPGNPPAPVPNYSYAFVQGGIDTRVQLGVVAILADGAYDGVVNDGIAASGLFPHAQVGAVATGLHLGFTLWEGLELRVGADYQRYFFSLNPVVGNANVAGGALDQYLAATVELGVRIR
jgi:hypothetical protein